MKRYFNYCIFIVSLLISTSLFAVERINESAKLQKDYSLSNSENITGSIAGSTTVCENSINLPEIIFSANGGTAPYTFSYRINGSGLAEISTSQGNRIVLKVSTSVAGNFKYSLLSVVDSNGNSVQLSDSATVTVTSLPDPSFNSSAEINTVNGLSNLKICSNTNADLILTNTSTTFLTNSQYLIDWGDGTPVFSESTWNTLTHTYKVGLWSLKYTVFNQNGCSISKTFNVFVGSNPAVSLGSPGNTDNCSNTPLTFPITGTESNPPGTTYTVTFNDGTPSQIFTHPPPAEITHTFNKTSCGVTSYNGTSPYPNSFSASVVASNACGVTAVNVVPIYISTSPVVNYNLPKTVTPTNSAITITNTTTGYVNVGANCSVVPKLVWIITPSTGFTLTSGTLGNDYGQDNSNLWVKGSDIITPVFTVPGTYKIKLRVDTKRCGNDQIEKTICVEAPLKPKFSLNVNSGCSPVLVSANNLTDLSTTCSSTVKWDITYSADNCGTTPASWSFANGSSSTSSSPSFVFTTPGLYKIKLSMTNTCGTTTTEQTISVSKPPTVSIEKISDFCGTALVKPKATISACTALSDTLTYLWSFPGGNPSSSTLSDPGFISYNTIGNYKISITVSNKYGSVNATSNTFNVNQLPSVNYIQNQLKNNEEYSDQIIFNGSDNTEFNWTNDNTSIGLPANGTGNILSFKTLNTSKAVIVAKINVLPKNKITNCVGESKSFTITVNPSGDLMQPANQIVSTGTTTTETVFVSNNKGGSTSFKWNNNRPEIGLPASGEGNVNSFVAINNTNSPIVATITVIPVFENGGQSSFGISKNFTITVIPTANMQQPENVEICNGVLTADVVFKSLNEGGETTFKWTNDNVEIGVAPSGNGNLPGFKAQNKDVVSHLATITVTPVYTYNGVSNEGISKKFTITVLAGPILVTQPQSSFICPGGQVTPLKVTYSDGVGSPTYQWFSNVSKSNIGGKLILNATSDTYIPQNFLPGTTYYYCEIYLPANICANLVSDVATVTINNSAIISTQPTKMQNLCVGGSIKQPLAIEFTGGSGIPTYKWYMNSENSRVGAKEIAGANQAAYLPAAFTVVGHYFYFAEVLLSGDGCGSVFSEMAEINVIPDPIILNQPMSYQNLCQDMTPENLRIEAGGGLGNFSYQWFENTVNNNSSGKPIVNQTSNLFTPSTSLTGTTYYYCEISQGNDVHCNVTSETAKVTVCHQPVITNQPVSSSLCLGNTIDSLRVLYMYGACVPNFQWFSNTTATATNGSKIPGATTNTYMPSINSIGETFYYCVLTFGTDGPNQMILTTNVASVSVHALPKISSQTLSVCSGNQFSFIPDERDTDFIPVSTNYTWSVQFDNQIKSVIGATSQSTPLSAIGQKLFNYTDKSATVTYVVTPVTGSCIGESFNLVVSVFPTIKIVPEINNLTCFDAKNGSIKIEISGGLPYDNLQKYTVEWTGPNDFYSTSKDITGLSTGEYTVTVTDAGGCPQSFTYSISQPTDIQIYTDLKRDINCYKSENGEISITVTGGVPPYNYLWSKDGIEFSTSKNISNLDQGVYSLQVTDANKCGIKTMQYTIFEPTALSISVLNQQNIHCFGENSGAITLDVSGGTPFNINANFTPYNYFWSGPNGFTANSKDLVNVPAGIYSLTVTDANGCSQTFTSEITQPTELTVLITKKPMTCYSANDASISLDISGGVKPYQVKWSNMGSGVYQDNLASGDYTITVTDANNCQKVITENIPEANFAIHPVVKNISCYGAHDGSISLKVTGGIDPISLEWLDNPTAGNQRNQLAPGIYTVVLHDAAPCNITESFLISEPQKIEITSKIENAFDCDNPNSGSIQLEISGGTPPYKYLWSNGKEEKDLLDLPQGKYFIIVTDSKACSQTAQFEIIRQKPLSVSVISENVLDCDSKKIVKRFTAKVNGGFSPYDIHWSNGLVSGKNNEITDIYQSSVIEVQVTDSLGCSMSYPFNVEVADAGIFFDMADCNKFSYRFNSLSNTFDDNRFTYFWDFGDGEFSTERNPLHIYQKSGLFNVQMTLSAGNCSTTFEETLIVSPLTKLKLDKEPKFCKGDSTILKVSGAQNYIWSNGTTGQYITIKKAGEYSVIGTSLNGCKDTLNFVASNYDLFNYTILNDGEDKVSENSEIHFWSENIPYSNYQWDFGDGKTEGGNNVYHSFKMNQAGYYDISLKIINPNGCEETATKRIWVSIPVEMVNTFSPNADGVNDVFMKGWQIKLYNRNGILLYEGNDGWDGIYKGQVVSKGVYYYIVYFKSDAGTKTETGYVRVIK